MCLTQNIDNLEEKTGINMDQVLQCHGANRGAACAKCKKPADKDKLQDIIREGKEIMYCEHCGGPVKPDITFFGESLPPQFITTLIRMQTDAPDLLLVMGTALAVPPFNNVPDMAGDSCPKVLFNMENVNQTSRYDFCDEQGDKIFVQGKCDESIIKLVKEIGWEEEFKQILPDVHKDKI